MRSTSLLFSSLALFALVACEKGAPTTSPEAGTAAVDGTATDAAGADASERLPQGTEAAGLDNPDVDHDKEGLQVTAPPATTEWFAQAFKAFGVGDIDPIVSNFGLDMTWEAVGSPLEPPSVGKPAVLERWEGLLTGIPDMKLTPQRIFKQGNLIVVQVVLTGTHLGDFRGLPPTKKPVGTEVLAWIWHSDDGTANKVRVVYNEGAILAQMGVIEGAQPPPIPEIPTGEPEIVEAEPNPKTEKLAKAWVKSWGPKAWSACKKKFCAAELVSHDASRGHSVTEPAEHEAEAKAFGTAVPDLATKPENVVTIGDWILVHAVMTGTHKGPLGKLEPTNKKLSLDSSTVAKTEGGKVVETWRYSNHLQLLDQLGMFRKPGAAAPAAAGPS